jgi:hypothetical protein
MRHAPSSQVRFHRPQDDEGIRKSGEHAEKDHDGAVKGETGSKLFLHGISCLRALP